VVGLTTGVVAVSAGVSHTCAITVASGVTCWGDDFWGQLGDGVALVPVDGVRRTSTPVDVVGLASGVVVMAAGSTHTCALTSTGGVLCWGANEQGQLGDGTRAIYLDENSSSAQGPLGRSVPGAVVGLTSGVTAIAVGGHSCAATSEAKVVCWGPNDMGQLGGGLAPEPSAGASPQPEGGPGFNSATPVDVVGLPAGLSSVSVGQSHTCAAAADGQVRCWGANDVGQLGDGTTLVRPGPVTLAAVNPQTVVTRAVKVNVIMVDSALDVTKDVPEAGQKAATTMAKRLTAQDPVLMRTIREAFRGATSGVVDPTVQVVTASKRLELSESGCVYSISDGELVQAAARPQKLEGAINVIVVRALICSLPDQEKWAGYDSPSPGNLPVVGWLALGEPWGLIHTMIHEYGHDAGLLHAGRSDCQDAVVHNGCSIDEVGDSASVMSYTHTTDSFTTAELYEMGFIGDPQVVSVRNSTAGEFRIGTGPGVSLALMIDQGWPATEGIPPLHEDRVYVSGEPGQLEVRFLALSGQQRSDGRYPPQPSLTSVVWFQPQPDTPIYREKDVTVTYRGCDADGNAILRVTRPSPTRSP